MIDTSAARNEILTKLRGVLADQGITPGEGKAALKPERTYRQSGEPAGSPQVLEMFKDCLEDYDALYVEVDLAEDPQAIEKTLNKMLQDDAIQTAVVPHGLQDSWKEAVSSACTMTVDGPGQRVSNQDLNATNAVVTSSLAGIALTGAIILNNQPDQGRKTCTLLPDYHYIVVNAQRVFHTVPEAVALMCKHPERTYTWSAGPSATADIEMVRVRGVHGPRFLRVIVVKNAPVQED